MTIKNKILSFLCCCMLAPAVSCNKDLLDRNPLDNVSSEIFWASESDANSGLAGVYTRLQSNFLGYERVYLDGLTDNAFLWDNTNQGSFMIMTTGSLSATLGGALANMYSSPYRAITSCNYFLDNIDKAPVAEAGKNIMKAEARFIRALCYFDLVQNFGGVIIYRNFPATLESAKIAKSTREEVYAFIEEDLDFAIANLPDNRYSGHAVKGSAQGMKGRVLITQQKWADAVAVLQQVTGGGKFALANNYAGLFRTAGQTNAAVNQEIMFSTQYLATTNPQRTSPGAAGMDIELGWYSLMQPYQDLVNDYEMTDGKPITESPLYNPAAPFANRDPRLDLSVKLPGETWRNAAGVAWTGSYSTFTGYLVEKYVDLSKAPFTTASATTTDQDYIHLRYADVLLMYAEAKNEVSGPDATVYAAINQVRGRAGINMPPVDEAKYNTKEKLRDYIRHERRVEFAFEGQRYNDLKRWNIAHIKLPTLKTPSAAPLVFGTQNYLLPFQQSELDNNPALVQNPGY
ncbi:RagB/SusD family nutrient uptake outer membrane protein [Segetibacter sp. 3557_3]|uniref:RagB/SusD family nutrient uptake outer membrane protein n=1 Tax=Segetibacter sp. 3557_3 TaxID=2547429 RepID=UPI0010585C3D|nr:RagB/SusD family nutrient uptake outer membrane protein [Segetibacter sp. 3557_3]TDH27491.1 RagB/SusD family nutrient uptake outer membrane protein [Segetibacter sp. 3557_3]